MERWREWTVAETPTRVQLNSVVTASGRVYAVRNRGVLLERTDDGWREIFDDGVDGLGRGLLDIDATDEGRWSRVRSATELCQPAYGLSAGRTDRRL